MFLRVDVEGFGEGGKRYKKGRAGVCTGYKISLGGHIFMNIFTVINSIIFMYIF